MSRELKIGLSVMLAILLIYLSLAWIKRIHFFSPTETPYKLQFEHVAGLLEGDPVYVRGYLAGRVTNIIPEAKSVSVNIMVNSKIALFEDAHAEIQLKELMSGKQVTIFQGSSSQPLPKSSVIPGTASLDFSSGFSTITEIAEGLPPARIQHFLNQIDSIFLTANTLFSQIDPHTVNRILDHTEASLDDIQQLTSEARDRKLIEKVDTTIIKVNSLIGKAETSLAQINQIADEIDTQKIDSLLQNLVQLTEEGGLLLSEVEALLDKTNDDEVLIGRLLNDPSFSHQVDSLLIHFDEVLKQIRNEKIYISVGKNKRGK